MDKEGNLGKESYWEKIISLVWGMLTLRGSQPFKCRCQAGRTMWATLPRGS